MSGRTLQRWTQVTAAALAAVVLVGCGTTTIDESVDPVAPAESLGDAEEAGAAEAESAEGDTPATSPTIEGSPADLLPVIGSDMSRLSAEIADEGDEDATIARLEGNWAAIRDAVEASDPGLVNGIQTTVDMARTAVDTNRPADADKAFKLLTDLVDAYNGDG